jgi:hypothetical protein
MALFAELIVYALYRKAHPEWQVLTQLEYLTVRTGTPPIDMFLDALASDFTNVFSGASRKAAQRTGDLSRLRAGGFRKPDVLGISPPGPDGITVELVEVSTEGQAGGTFAQDLQEKLGTLNDYVLPIMELQAADEFGQSFAPIRVRASPWRPGQNELVWPVIPTNMSSSRIEWICLKPTFRRNWPLGEDGLVLYEIHSVGVPELVPQDVLDRLREEMRRRQGQPAFLLQPSLEQHWGLNPADRQVLETAALVAAGALVLILVVAFLPEEALAGLAAATVRGLSVAVSYLPQALEWAGGVLQSLARTPALVF